MWGVKTRFASEKPLICRRNAGFETPQGTTPALIVNLFLNGTFIGPLSEYQPVTPGATQTFNGVVYAFEPGSDTPQTLTAKLYDPCGAHFTVSDLKLDVVALA